MKQIPSILCLLAFALSASAVPALRQKHVIRLTDGSSIQATLLGDEYCHYFLDAQGRTYQTDGTGLYRQVDMQSLQLHASQRMQRAIARRGQRNTLQQTIPGANPKKPYTGEKNCLVILADFSDSYMTYTTQEFDRFFNEIGYTDNGMTGSVRDYFLACSYGQLDIHFDVVGPVGLKKSVTYYGSNDSHGDDRHPGQMVGEAIQGAEALGVDFSKYDWDGDGKVEQVFVIYAGYGEAQSGIETNIWPHENALSVTGDYGDGPGALTFDGVTIDTYATSCELAGKRGLEVDGIGTACHEFSHCMGLPDTYDALQTGNYAMDVWDIMDYGCYNGTGGKMGSCPWEFTSYERAACGWLIPTVLQEGCEVCNMRPLNEAPEAYIVYNEGHKNEYYLLENRQLRGFDAGGYGHGLLVIHVDYDSHAWYMNMLNTERDHQRMTLIPADGSCISLARGIGFVAGDPFPGTHGQTSLTDQSNPKATLYHANTDGQKLMHKPITQIAENTEKGTLSFTFCGGGSVINAIDVSPAEEKTEQKAFDLLGRWTENSTRGVMIRNGMKYLQ